MPKPIVTPLGNTKPSTLDQITLFEKRFQVELPNNYKSFLQESNGGAPKPFCFKYYDKRGVEETAAVDVFLHTGSGEWSLTNNVEMLFSEKRVPKDYLPIAWDKFGDLICLVLQGSETGQIRSCPHDMGLLEIGNDGYPKAVSTNRIANSLEEFLESFCEDDTGD